MLECVGLGVTFGGLKAVEDFDLTIGRTEIAGLIGPNGAGKTTVFNLLTKVYQPTRGTIMVDGRDTSCSQKEMEEALLRACQAVDRQRKKVLYLYEERRQRIKSLVDSFNALRESEADAEQLEKQVGELVKTVEDPSLLQETLVAVVIGCMGAGQAEWGMNIITRLWWSF